LRVWFLFFESRLNSLRLC